ncbi:MAG TPA: hypothetical protein ENN33_05605 [Ignavibacteria bacterium]|nr:hypothetical protein [Ignavibacteria bacterium]
MGKYPYNNLKHEELYYHLNVVDTKCATLLQLSGIVLMIGTVSLASDIISNNLLWLLSTIFTIFLVISFLSLSVVWLHWSKSNTELIKILKYRTRVYNICVILTAIGLISIAVYVFCTLGT